MQDIEGPSFIAAEQMLGNPIIFHQASSTNLYFICYFEIASCILVSNFSDLALHRFIQRFAHIEHHVSANYAFKGSSFLGKQRQ